MSSATSAVLAWQTADSKIYVAYNRGTADVTVTIPTAPAGLTWYRVADTGAWDEPDANIAAAGNEYMMHQSQYNVTARSLALFIAR
jgi:hypothetical protein